MGPLHQKLTNVQINRDSAHILSMTPKRAYWISKLEIDRDWKLIAKNPWNMHTLRSKRVQKYIVDKNLIKRSGTHFQVANLVMKMSPHFERVLNWSITIATNIWPKACTVLVLVTYVCIHTHTFCTIYAFSMWTCMQIDWNFKYDEFTAMQEYNQVEIEIKIELHTIKSITHTAK